MNLNLKALILAELYLDDSNKFLTKNKLHQYIKNYRITA